MLAAGHAVLHKRDSRAAIAWVGFIWFVPLVGAVMYFIFGLNRIRHRAALLRRNLERYRAQAAQPECPPEELQRHLPDHGGHLQMLARVVGGVVERPLLRGNRIDPLVNGDEAYPAMLEAIQHARQTVSFVTYIFDRDEVGMAFAHALGEAVRRGVEVRVLIDATGTRYSWPTILHTLRREGVKYARFLPSFALWHVMSMNMRTHRKILVADGRVGFTGGMNIRAGHCLQRQPPHPVQDIHFRVKGPVVTQLQEVFTDDWLFTTGEALRGDSWFPKTESEGQVLARGVPDGPDENFEKLHWTLLGALSIARYSVRIMTPYFLPDPAVVSALNLASMRGVQVDIYSARTEQPAVHPVGFPGHVVAGAPAWMQDLADPASLRSLETHAGGWLLGAAGISQLGSAKLASQLRVQRGMLRRRTRPAARSVVRDETEGRPSCDDGGGRWPSAAGSPARRHCAIADAVLVVGNLCVGKSIGKGRRS